MEKETENQAYERLKPLPDAGIDYLIGHGDGWNDHANWQKQQDAVKSEDEWINKTKLSDILYDCDLRYKDPDGCYEDEGHNESVTEFINELKKYGYKIVNQ